MRCDAMRSEAKRTKSLNDYTLHTAAVAILLFIQVCADATTTALSLSLSLSAAAAPE